jgi:CRISPR type III-B/RAMP module-associated protein Cmr5
LSVQNIAHDNAKEAFKQITCILNDKDNKTKKEYLSLVRGTDALIHQCGLLQTLAFYLSKKKEHHVLLTSQLLEHLGLPNNQDQLIDGYNRLLNKEDSELMRKTAQARRYLLWLKRYAEAMIDPKEVATDEEEDGSARE